MDKPLRIIVKVQPLALDDATQPVAQLPRPRISTLNAVRDFARSFRPQ